MLIRESVSLFVLQESYKTQKENQAVKCIFYVGMYFNRWDLNSLTVCTDYVDSNCNAANLISESTRVQTWTRHLLYFIKFLAVFSGSPNKHHNRISN